MTRCRSLHLEVDKLDDQINLLDSDERRRLGAAAAVLRDVLDLIEQDIESMAARR
jgi:hypothetical protein